MKAHSFSRFALAACTALILLAALWYPKWNMPYTEATLSWDVSGYYLYLPALFIYQDVEELAFMDSILETYGPTTGLLQAHRHHNGSYIMQYSMGQALLYLPFFLVGHVVALVSAYPADGFSWPYQVAIHWGSLLAAFLGLWLLRTVLLRYFSDRVTGVTLLAVVFATNYLNYASIHAAMPHNYLFSLYALLIFLTIRLYERPGYGLAAAVGLCLGLVALTRPSEAIALLIPLAWGAGWRQFPERWRLWRRHWPKLVLAAALTLAVGSLQLIYWKIVGGDWLIYSYQDQGFSWTNPHFREVFFSYKKGWLVYTPVLVLAFAGLLPLARKRPQVFWGVLFFLVVNVWIVSAWDIWWYGGSFGQRAMVQSYALWAFPLAAWFEWAAGAWGRRWLAGALLVACAGLNLFQTWQVNGHGLDAEMMTKAYYWRIFLNPDVRERDKFLMDTDEDYLGVRTHVRRLHWERFEDLPHDTLHGYAEEAYSGRWAAMVNPTFRGSRAIEVPYEEQQWKGNWVRVSGYFFPEKKIYNLWDMTQWYAQFFQGEAIVKQSFIRLERIAPPGRWTRLWLDTRLPDVPFDRVRVFLYSPGGDQTMYLDDLQIEIYEGSQKGGR